MAAMKQARVTSHHPTIQSNFAPPAPVLRHVVSASEPSVNGKKKKKKKSKAKSSGEPDMQNAQTDDDIPSQNPPSLHQVTNATTTTSIPSLSGLLPELESVNLSASAHLNPTVTAQEELLATAHDLYRRMDTDSMPDDEDYWAALPTHIKNFVKMTYSNSTNPNINASERSKAQSVLAIAHQMIQSGAEKIGPKGGGGGGHPPGAFPAFPFDPAILSDPAFLAMEQTLATGGPLPQASGQPPRGPLPRPNVVLLNEYNGNDHHEYDYSEDDVEQHEHHHEHRPSFLGYEYRTNNNGNSNTNINNVATEAGKKKSKKKKKKGGVVMTSNAPALLPLPAAQHQQPPPSRPAPPSNPPLPSSRAAGKQPMLYNTNLSRPSATTQNTPSRSAKTTTAVAKVPHHPSPTSSQTSHGKRNTTAIINNNNALSTNKLWSTNSNEERERIKEFWLGLSEEERRALVKVEKEAVLKKMKEQQKHSCSCAVCGRKRHAIEEELEVLYDAYYEELEQYAVHQQQYASSGGTIPPPPGPGPFPGSVELDKNGAVVGAHNYHHHHHHHINNNNNNNNNRTINALTGRTIAQQHYYAHPTRDDDNTNAQRKGGVNISDVPVPVHVNPRKGPESEFEDDDGEDEYEEEEGYEEDEEDDEDDDEEGDDADDDERSEKRLQIARRGTGPPEDGGGRTGTHLTNSNGDSNNAVNGVKLSNNDVTTANNTHNVAQGGGAGGADDIFNFKSSLTVTGVVGTSSSAAVAVASSGNILTVADDLLKNDGRKFLEMMEQLAERRMQREEEAAAEVGRDSDEVEDEEDEDEDEEDEEDEDEDEEDEDEAMTEEQRMEEGRRMFSIFAARMFEQRVLQSYREKVAQERQQEILRELENEDKAAQEREAKKQKENQKKKAKRLLQKQVKEEEKRQRESEKAAEELALKAKQQAHEEEIKKKREEERSRREAARKLQEEERARKEEERRRRIAEEKERLAEQERKRKERDERLRAERREREEKDRKAKEEKEAKLSAEKAAAAVKREHLAKEEREKRAQKEIEERKEREAKERLLREQQRANTGAAAVNVAVVPSQHGGGKASPRGTNIPGALSRISIPPPAASKNILKPPMTPVTSGRTVASSNALSSSFQPAINIDTTPPGAINILPVPMTASMMQALPLPSSHPPHSPRKTSITTQTQAQTMSSPQPQHPIPVPFAPSTQIQSPGTSITPISTAGFHHGFTSPGTSGVSGAISLPGQLGTPFTTLPTSPFMPYGPPAVTGSVLVPPPGIPPPSMSRGGFSSPVFESFRPLGGGGGTPSIPSSLPSAICQPPKGLPSTPGSPISIFSSTGALGSSSTSHHLRRGSVQERPMFGAVQRPVAPLAPIARPQNSKDDSEKTTSSPKIKSSSSTSTPASEQVLGSSALVADDDEPIIIQPRRVAAPLGWGTPQSDPLNTRIGWSSTASQGLSFGNPTRTPGSMWGLCPDPWQQPGSFSQHPPFPAFANSSPPGGS